MSRIHTPFVCLLALALILLATPGAAAQSGPAPGYEDPLLYGGDYALNQTTEATADPAGYATGMDAKSEVNHAAWLACWTADEYLEGEPTGACANYYQAPVEASPANQSDNADEPPADGAVQPVEEPVTTAAEETAQATDELAAEVSGSVNQLLDDPTSAPSVLERLGAAAVSFARAMAGTAAKLVGALQGVVVGTAQGLVDGVGLGVRATGTGLTSLGDGVVALADIPLEATHATGTSIATGATATGDAIGAGFKTVAEGAGTVATAIGGGFFAVGEAFADAASAITDAWGSLFNGSSPTEATYADGTLDTVQDLPGTDGLLSKVDEVLDS